MSLFINCQWFPDKNASLSERIGTIAHLFRSSTLTTLIGKRWYALGYSRKQSLSRPVLPSHLQEINTWRFTHLIEPSGCYRMDLWNGIDSSMGITVLTEINSPPNRLDTLVIQGPEIDILRTSLVPWTLVLSCGRCIAEQLGGLAVISSHELIDYALKNNIEKPNLAGYGAFWGPDRSGMNPAYRPLMEEGISPPFSIVTSNTWAQVQSPNYSRLKDLMNLLKRGIE
jgi:hypothetical protein